MIIEYLIYNSKHDHKKNNFESIFPGAGLENNRHLLFMGKYSHNSAWLDFKWVLMWQAT